MTEASPKKMGDRPPLDWDDDPDSDRLDHEDWEDSYCKDALVQSSHDPPPTPDLFPQQEDNLDDLPV